MRPLFILIALALLVATGCTETGRARPDGGPGGGGFDAAGLDGALVSDAGIVRPDAAPIDPFDPDAACGASSIPTQRVPGSLLIVFDRSGSMREAPRGDVSASNPSKWDRSLGAVRSVLGTVPDELSAGLMLFPTGEGSECSVSLSGSVPHVAIAPLSTSRPQIDAALTAASPSGGNTPIFSAVRTGYDYLDTLTTAGQRGLVVVTDGAETCASSERSAVMARVAEEHASNGYLTYVVGLTTSNSDLSTMAYNGGTPRNDTCLPQCTTPVCSSAADCMGGATCQQIVAGFPGFCSCGTDADCPAPTRCTTVPILGWRECSGEPNCCHYDASASTFTDDFEMALREIAQSFLDSCVFDLPRGADPSTFDPGLVNVGVTFEGEARTVLRRGSDGTVDSWSYTSSEHRSIVIQGPICERLLESSATVEIALGCATILI